MVIYSLEPVSILSSERGAVMRQAQLGRRHVWQTVKVRLPASMWIVLGGRRRIVVDICPTRGSITADVAWICGPDMRSVHCISSNNEQTSYCHHGCSCSLWCQSQPVCGC